MHCNQRGLGWGGTKGRKGPPIGQWYMLMAETLRRVLSPGRTAGPGEDGAAEAGPPLLLLGGPGSGKTALLFAAALEAAGEGRGPVLFLTRRPLQSLPRRTPAALDPLRLQVTGRRNPKHTSQWRGRSRIE